MAKAVKISIEVEGGEQARQVVASIRSAVEGSGEAAQKATPSYTEMSKSVSAIETEAQQLERIMEALDRVIGSTSNSARASVQPLGGMQKALAATSAEAKNAAQSIQAAQKSFAEMTRAERAQAVLGPERGDRALRREVSALEPDSSLLDRLRADTQGFDELTLSAEASAEANKKAEAGFDDLRQQLRALRGDIDALPPSFGGASAAAEASATGWAAAGAAALALGVALHQTASAAIDAYAATDEGARKLDELEKAAQAARIAYGREFQSEVEATVAVLSAGARAAESLASGLAFVARAATGIGPSLQNASQALNEARERVNGPEDAGRIALARLKANQADVIASEKALTDARVQRIFERVQAAEREAAEMRRIYAEQLRNREAFEREIANARNSAADPRARIAYQLEDDLRRVQELASKPGVDVKALAQLNDDLIAGLSERREELDKRAEELAARQQERVQQQADRLVRSQQTAEERILQERKDTLDQIDQLEAAKAFNAETAAEQRVRAEESASAAILKLRQREAAESERANARVEASVKALEARATATSLDVFERIMAQKQARIEAVKADVNASIEQINRAIVASEKIAANEIDREQQRVFDEQQRRLEQQGREWELFWDRVSRNAKSTGDFLSNLWDEVQNDFRRSVIQMVGSLVFGQQQVQRVSAGGAGGGGGALGGFASILFGGAGGGFGGVGGAATPPFVQNFVAGSGVAYGSSNSRSSAGVGSIPAGVPTGRGGGLLDILSGVAGGRAVGGLQTLGPLLGLTLGLSGGSPLSGALLGLGGVVGGTALAGGLAAASVGAGFFGGAGVALAGLASNPVGLAILGGVVAAGGIAGLLSRNRNKVKASEIANDGFGRIDDIVDRFKNREIQYVSAIDGMDKIWEEMAAKWDQIGGSVGRNSTADQSRYFEQRVAEVDRIQRERLDRLERIAALPDPVFHSGGLVGGYGDVPATLQGGEFVVRKQVVDQVGSEALQRLNLGGAGRTSVTVNFHGPVSDGMREFFRGGEFVDQVLKAIRQAKGEGRLR